MLDLRTTLANGAAEADRLGQTPWASIQAVHEAGLLTATVGNKMPRHEFVSALTSLGAGDPSVALITLMTQMQHIAAAEGIPWPDGVYEQTLNTSQPVLLNAALTEPALGSAIRGGSYATTARQSDGGWIVNGTKSFVTGSEHLAYHLVSVSTTDGHTARAVVPGTREGIRVVHSWDGIGMRASSTHEVVYDNVEIPESHLIALPESDSPRIGEMFSLGISAIYLGIAQAARDELTRYLNERVPSSLGASLATVGRMQDAVGEIEAELISSEETLSSLTRGAGLRVGAAKLITTRAAISVVQAAVKLASSYGLSRSGPLERHLRDVLCAGPQPPHDDMVIRRLGTAALQ